MIQGHGQDSPLMIVGDYPDKRELESGAAWECTAGSLLRQLINSNGWSWPRTYRTTAYKNRMPEVWSEEKDKRKRANIALPEFDKNLKLLKVELEQIKPRVIIAAGEFALNLLCGKEGIDKYRGSILPLTNDMQVAARSTETIVVPIIHPRDLFRQYSAQTYTGFDIARAVKYINERYIPPEHKYQLWVCREPENLRSFLNRNFHDAEFYTTDIETFNGFLTCASLCFNGKEAISIPLMEFKSPIETRRQLWELLAKVWASDKPKVNQNIKYDQTISEHWGFIYENVFDDTMLLAHSLYPELPKGLDFLTSIYTDIPYYKDEGKEFDPALHPKDQLYLYNAKDALATWLVYKEQINDARTTQIWPGYTVENFHRERQFPLYDIYRRSDKTGILVDLAQRDMLTEKYTSMLELVSESISKAVGFPYNHNSPAQAKDIVYERFKLPPQKKRDGKGRWTTTADEEALEELILNHVDRTLKGDMAQDAKNVLQLMLTARHLDGALEWLGTPYHLSGRMHQSSKVHGTESGRTSASRTPFYAWGIRKKGGKYEIAQLNLGMSFQTVPKHGKRLADGTTILNDLTTIFVPDDGYVFIEGDKSQAEARVVVVLANDIGQLKYFDKPNDIHLLTTSWCTGVGYDELLELKKAKGSITYLGKPTLVADARQDIGKPARHAGNYDMEAPRLSLMGHMPLTQAEKILTKFHEACPSIRNVFHSTVRDLVGGDRVLVNPYGRRRYFFDRITPKYFKEAYAQLPQSTVSDHVKFDILTPMDRRWYKHGVRVLNEKHDSLLFLAPLSLKDDVCHDFKLFGQTPINFRNGSIQREVDLIIPTDVQWSDKNWKEMTEWSA